MGNVRVSQGYLYSGNGGREIQDDTSTGANIRRGCVQAGARLRIGSMREIFRYRVPMCDGDINVFGDIESKKGGYRDIESPFQELTINR